MEIMEPGKVLDVCRLPASGFTDTLNGVYDWATKVVAKVRSDLGVGPVRVSVWAYREQERQWLAADFHADDFGLARSYPMTFVVGETHDFDLEEPNVPDMTEALHMVGILCEALGATIEIGRRCNEVNRYCTPEAWGPGQTNARLVILVKAKE